ncbi:hypothetical protein DY000_02007481 [Brassica cretica]|uniref:WDHD1/CFT4 second beta-propeller domain-containing protein n=1 Tax=Brassica cretica TaxID=69181 RepID=A0ABQ7C548_BRACR|nr:hypothetical protein DY000_02007481 [Brassica cretica]
MKWTMRFEGEEVKVVANGSGWVAAITSLNLLHIFTEGGLQVSSFAFYGLSCVTMDKHVISLGGPVVTATGCRDQLAVVTHVSDCLPSNEQVLVWKTPRTIPKKISKRLLEEFSRRLLAYSDLRQTLKDFSKTFGRLLKDSRKTPRKTSRQVFYAFYSRRLPTKFSRSLMKSYGQSDLSPTLKDFLEDSWKTLERLLKDFLGSFLMYYMLEDFSRNLREVFRSLLPKVVQKNDVKWSPSLSMLRNDI